MKQQILRGYSSAAVRLIQPYESISSADLFAPVAHLLPGSAGRLIDIGAGTGRDAAWFAAQGFDVVAVEPVAAFRKAGASLHRAARIEWLDDSLPTLSRVLAHGSTFDVVVVNGVWQHIDPAGRRIAMPAIAAATAPGGRLVLSLRYGPGAPGRPTFETPVEETVDLAHASGFRLDFRQPRESIQAWNRAAGVTWTWMVFSLAT